MAAKTRVIITGELVLVEEYAVMLRDHGFLVSVRPNPGPHAIRFPKGISKVASIPKGSAVGLELTNCDLTEKRNNLRQFERALSPRALILSSSVTVSLSEQSSWVSTPERIVGIGALPSLLSGDLIEFATSSSTAAASLDAALNFASTLRKETAVVKDSVGMVLPRILCMLANEACFAISERVAPASGIDTAMKLGTNYPKGPVEWAELLGPDQVNAVMLALQRHFGEDRYRPAPLLAAAARRGTLLGA